MIAEGADVNTVNAASLTPPQRTKIEAMVKLLLDHGADVNARGHWQRTPLFQAQNIPMARFLVNRGAHLTAVDINGWTALHWAAFQAKLEVCLFLVSRGLDPNIRDNDYYGGDEDEDMGNTALDSYGSA